MAKTTTKAANKRQITVIDTTLALLAWKRWIESQNNKTFLPLFADEHKHLIVKGGGGSGKSIWAGNKILSRCRWEPGHRFLVVRKTAKSLRESCFHQLATAAYRDYAGEIDRIPKGKSGDMYIRFRNGSEIIFAGLDDVEKLKSIYEITDQEFIDKIVARYLDPATPSYSTVMETSNYSIKFTSEKYPEFYYSLVLVCDVDGTYIHDRMTGRYIDMGDLFDEYDLYNLDEDYEG